MLSYRHSFHAGNFADVLKHIVLVEILLHLGKKNKPFAYIDTHAGAGMYDLMSSESNKLAEHKSGIDLIKPDDFPELADYFKLVATANQHQEQLNQYPGSPFIALQLMRPGDRAWFHELHAKDCAHLTALINSDQHFKAKSQVSNKDGYRGLMGLLPPLTRRGLVLIDPSYEVKAEYQQMIDVVVKAQQKFATGVFAIWYPVVDRRRIKQIDHILYKSGIRDVHKYELAVAADSTEHGMTATGMWIINPPWGLFEKMQKLLPKLQRHLSSDPTAFHRCEVLVPE